MRISTAPGPAKGHAEKLAIIESRAAERNRAVRGRSTTLMIQPPITCKSFCIPRLVPELRDADVSFEHLVRMF